MSASSPPPESFPLDGKLPQGGAALHPDWPEASFSVTGMFVYDKHILAFVKGVEQEFGCRVAIRAIHGAPFVAWNGGRFQFREIKPGDLPARLNDLYALGIGCFPTFTNHLLEAGDLNDAACNSLLDAVGRRPDLNGVLITSELLSKYVAQRYPALRQVASITKVVAEGGKGNASYYNELGKRFYRYVVHPDDCGDLALLDQLDRTKAEIILNENCLRGCTNRPRHYELIAGQQKRFHDYQSLVAQAGSVEAARDIVERERQADPASAFSCPIKLQVRRVGGPRLRNCNLTRSEVKTIYDMGFRHFKLQGRIDNPCNFAYDLTRYTLEPDFIAPWVYKLFCPEILKSFRGVSYQSTAPLGDTCP